MDIRYKRSHNKSYMLININTEKNEFEERMICQNNVEAILDFYSMEIENQTVYWHNITGKESLKDYIDTCGVSLEMLERLLLHFHLACEEISKFLISQEHFLVGIDTVYIEKAKKSDKVCFCYTPEECGTITHQFRSVLEYILTVLDHSDEELTAVCYELYDIACKDDYSIMELLDRVNEAYCDLTMPNVEKINLNESRDADISRNYNYVNKISENKLAENKNRFIEDKRTDTEYDIRQRQLDDLYDSDDDDFYSNFNGAASFEIPERKSLLKSLFGNNRKSNSGNNVRNKQKINKKINKKDGRDVFDNYSPRRDFMDFEFDPEEEITKPTVLLSEANGKTSMCAGKLMYDGSEQEDSFLIDRDSYSIGTSKKGNNAILNSKAVSRNHARITRQGSQYYIEDLNSTNGTYVNDRPVDYRQQVPINSMDEIRFADVRYVFM